MFLFLAVFFISFHDELKEGTQSLVDRFGYPALFLLTLLADTVIQPVPPDVFVFGSGFGGANPVSAGAIAGIASSLGGLCGYFLGRWLGPWRFSRLFGRRLLRLAGNIYRKYGWLAIVVGAITPVPFSAVCWVGGIFRISPMIVLITGLLSRVPRFIFVGWIGAIS
jgi:membrane protein YqaA with SNARE-associated domain